MQLIDPLKISWFKEALASQMIEVDAQKNGIKFEVRHALSGGYTWFSSMCPYPESSPNPATVYTICTATY